MITKGRARVLVTAFAFLLLFGTTLQMAASPLDESEPNDTPEQANSLLYRLELNGEMSPAADVDWFTPQGPANWWWAHIILDTSQSTAGQDARLTFYGEDAVTPLQSDAGSWSKGSVLTFQNFIDGSAPHYVKVEAENGADTISPYTIRYYRDAATRRPEQEPNDAWDSAQVASRSNLGAIDSEGDVDCYAIDVYNRERFLFALNGDPEGDGSQTDFALQVLDPSGDVVTEADISMIGGNEFIDSMSFEEEGVHYYCVSASAGVTGETATYHSGIQVNERTYIPRRTLTAEWQNPRPGLIANPGEDMVFRATVSNTGRLPWPADNSLTALFNRNGDCSHVVEAPGADTITDDRVLWRLDEIAAGANIEFNLTLQGDEFCSDQVWFTFVRSYYGVSTTQQVLYSIATEASFLPLILR